MSTRRRSSAPTPPRCIPSPAESARNSWRSNVSGKRASATSTLPNLIPPARPAPADLDPAARLPLARSLPAVADDRRTAAGTRVEHVPDERLARPGIHPLDPHAEAPPPARHDALRAGRRQRADDRLGNLLGAVVRRERDRGRRKGPHDRPLPGN